MISPEMQDKLDSIQDKLGERGESEQILETSLQPQQQYFPGWEPETRAAPNAMLRGALFSATQGKNRRMCEREVIATMDNYEIRYTGISLNQADLNLWETIMHIARNNPAGEESTFSIYEILKHMGRGHSVRDYESIKNSLARLRSADVEITTKDEKTYFGPLCGIAGELDKKTDSYRFKFSEGLICLFDSGWSKLDYQHRKTIKDKPLALWLHGLFCSHAKPYPIKIETLHKLCGSETKEVKYFKKSLKKALNELVDINYLKSFEFKGNLLKVKKTPSQSQLKHLKKRGLDVK
jgi:hypothetical protein